MTAPRLGRWTLLAALLLVASCTDTSNAPSGRGLPISLSVFSGNGQNGTVGQELPLPIKVLATDGNNQPIANQVVNFVVTAGGGSVFAGTALTNVNGIAAEVWRLGTVAGSVQTVEVRAVAPDGTPSPFLRARHARQLPLPQWWAVTGSNCQPPGCKALRPASQVPTKYNSLCGFFPLISWTYA
jgi:hypothetical protein